MLGSRGDLNDCLGFNVDPVNHIVGESRFQGILRFQTEKVPKKHPTNHLVRHNQWPESA
jgi:hypothetical protein